MNARTIEPAPGSVPTLRDGLLAGGAPRMWERIFHDCLPAVREVVPAGSRVLEVGYGDGRLSCWLASELGWKVVGLDVSTESREAAREWSERYGLSEQLDFRLCRPDETRRHRDDYDAVFVKTVFYSSANLAEYEEWLDWIVTVLRPGGVLVNFESGKANGLVQTYRRLRRRPYTDLCLYTAQIERLYDARFGTVFRRHYDGLSQFLAPVPGLYEGASWLEASLAPRTAENCFAVANVGRRRV